MTTHYQKLSEQAYATQVAKILKSPWQISNAPNELHWPDLLISTDKETFGLEVREIYPEQLLSDSQALLASDYQTLVNGIKEAYETSHNRPLRVNFIGDISQPDVIVKALIKCSSTLDDFAQTHFSPYPGVHLYISALPTNAHNHERWLYVAEQQNKRPTLTKERISNKIKEKSAKLNRYSKNIDDVRLLLVSNALFKLNHSHKKMLHSLTTQGFKKVYLLSFPNRVDVIN